MNDYDFGNCLYEQRTRLGYTQAELAEAPGVTNKAVSKQNLRRDILKL